jgi:hypothetical protein
MKASHSLGLAALGVALVLASPAVASSHDGEHDRRSAQGAAHGNPTPTQAQGRRPPALAAPVISSCGTAEDSTNVTWGAVTDATKYSVEYTVGYDLTGDDGCADAFLEFEYGTTDTTLAVPLADFAYNFCTEEEPCVAEPVSITVRVKGLNPPAGGPKGGSPQNNPFSDLCVILADSCSASTPAK